MTVMYKILTAYVFQRNRPRSQLSASTVENIEILKWGLKAGFV